MSLLAHVREEKYKILLASTTSAIGFFFALVANSLVEENREREAFASMVKAIQVEAAANNDVLETGFRKFYKDGIVFQQFNTSTASLYLANAIYLKFSRPTEVANLSQYIRELALSNRYREKVETLRMAGRSEDVAQHIVKSWEINIDNAQKAIAAIQNTTR